MVIAIDFDGTLVSHSFPDLGEPRIWLIERAKKWKAMGHKLILWTCREDVTDTNRYFRKRLYLQEAIDLCASFGLTFDAVNANIDEHETPPGYFSRKIFADVYLDDKSVSFSDSDETFSYNSILCRGGDFLV